MSTEQLEESSQAPQPLWVLNDRKAQKNGPHRSIHWVKKRKPDEDGHIRGEKWIPSHSYTGEWVDNARQGYGVMYFQNGNKYEGEWYDNKRWGQGTLWKLQNPKAKKYRRIYTGEWEEDKKSGQGSFFFDNEDRYDGSWSHGKRHGQGRMLYANGDIYEGQWVDDMRDGYGALTKANGDYFEGYWRKDMRHGQGSYFFSASNKLYVGEWINDAPKCGVYTEVEDDDIQTHQRPKYFTDAYVLPPIPDLMLVDPQEVLTEAIEEARRAEQEIEDEDEM